MPLRADTYASIEDSHPELAQAAAVEGGWTADQVRDAQRLAVDFAAKEVLDSSVLEGGDAEYRTWLQDTAPEYMTPQLLRMLQADTESPIILGNHLGARAMPALVHDGGPRIDTVSPALEDLAHASVWAEKGITVSIRYSARYWVADQEAAAFAGQFLDMTAEEFLATGDAKEQLRDGTGKNIYTSEGTVTAHAVPQPDGKMLLNTVSGVFNFGSSDFTG